VREVERVRRALREVMRGELEAGRRRRAWHPACLAAGVACASLLAAPARAAVRRDALDESEVAAMRTTHPHAADLLERGEALAAEGRLVEAERSFSEAAGEHGSGSLLQRRRCEVLTALGRRAEATTACYRALEGARSNANVRASVRALVWGPVPPTMTEAGLALDLAIKARDRAPGQLTPIAALCDIAESLGDGIMLEHCADDLHRIAPEAPDTRRAEGLLASRRSPARGWAALGVLSAGLVATLTHALRRARRSRRVTRGAAIAAGLVLGVLLARPGVAAADVPGQQPGMLSKWPIDDANPAASLPSEAERNKDPLEFGYWLQDVILRAEVYSKHGKHDVAVKLYTALAMAVPERAIAFTKMCEEYEALGDGVKATAACETALLREGLLVKDYEHYVRLVLATPGPLTERQTKALAQVIDHMRQDPAGRAAADALDCDVGVRTSNAAELEACTGRLAASAPHDPATLSYQWALAMLKGDREGARDLVSEARRAGLLAERVTEMERAMAGEARGLRLRRVALGVAVVCFLGALGFVLLRAARRRESPQAA
jgi:tetratricopeptide (TPR) repeat protein